jgi:adenine deaminase
MNPIPVLGKLTDIENKKIYPAEIKVENGRIISINRDIHDLQLTPDDALPYILPGFIDSHVHIESSMLVPSEFAKLAVVHGTVATVSDPHEIANVCGIKGVEFMIENGRTVPFKFNFGAPSCVPATIFETAGATLNADAVEALLQRDDIKYLSEMMNFPGVLNEEEEVMKKINAAHRRLKPVDGHAPGLRSEQARQYIAAGITTDHECFTADEALDKLRNGMKILIREGSAAKNFDALIDLLNDYPHQMMFCSDDKHPDSLVAGHINQLCARAITKGIDIFKILQAACVNPVLHYKLDVGLLKEGDPADFILVKDLKAFEVIQTYINGELVAENGITKIKTHHTGDEIINNFHCSLKKPEDFVVTAGNYLTHPHGSPLVANGSLTLRQAQGHLTLPVIKALDGQLITNRVYTEPKISDGNIVSEPEKDILKIVVVNRYNDAPVAKSFVKNFGLKNGAIASSVAHDSHNIVAVGTDDMSICRAVNIIINAHGGISCVSEEKERNIPLPVAGLMSNEDGYKVAGKYTAIDKMAKSIGSTLSAPFMTLSFMALLVIPHLKLSDKGLFDGDRFQFV